MKLYEIYFSPTNGTKRVADIICNNLNYEKIEIDLFNKSLDLSKYNFSEEDICLVAIPSFGGRVPAIVISSLQKLKAQNTRAICVTVYGNRAYDDSLLELKNTLSTSGFRCFAAIAAIAEHSIMHQFGNGRPDIQDETELISFSNKLKTAIENTNEVKEVQVPGNKPYREYHGVPLKPTANNNCTKCGLCAANCPVNAISTDNPATVDKEKCISCMHCISICPNHSRNLNKVMLSAASAKLKKACSTKKENELFL